MNQLVRAGRAMDVERRTESLHGNRASTLWEFAFFAAVLRRLYDEPDGTTGAAGEDRPGPNRLFPPGDEGDSAAGPTTGTAIS